MSPSCSKSHFIAENIFAHNSVYTICLLGQKQLNPPAKSKEVLVVVVVVLFAFYLIGFRVACMDASNETYFKLQELARKKLIYEIYNLFPRPRLTS